MTLFSYSERYTNDDRDASGDKSEILLLSATSCLTLGKLSIPEREVIPKPLADTEVSFATSFDMIESPAFFPRDEATAAANFESAKQDWKVFDTQLCDAEA